MNLKPSFDQALTEGMNRLVCMSFTSSPPELGLPGQEYFAGTHLNPNVTWWRDAGTVHVIPQPRAIPAPTGLACR